MRIIGGHLKKRPLKSFEGKDIRPTSDRLREKLFNILQHAELGLKDLMVMDIFAGTGAMGIEAISRGAKKVIFVEKSPQSIALIEENLKSLDIKDQGLILKQSAHYLAQGALSYQNQMDLVFMDAPFPKSQELTTLAILGLIEGNWLSEHAWLIAEVPSNLLFEPPKPYEIFREIKAGRSKALLMKQI